MQCKVKYCDSYSKCPGSKISFFRFPREYNPNKLWTEFCQQSRIFNTKTAYICMKHFTPDDLENRIQYDMGFAKCRILKSDAMPSIFNPLAHNQTQENHNFVELGLRNCRQIKDDPNVRDYQLETAAPYELLQEKESNEISNLLLQESDDPLYIPLYEEENDSSENLSNTSLDPAESIEYLDECNEAEEIAILQNEMEDLRRENLNLLSTQKKQISQIMAFKRSAIQEDRKYEFNMKLLQKRLSETIDKTKNLKKKLQSIYTEVSVCDDLAKARNKNIRKLNKTARENVY